MAPIGSWRVALLGGLDLLEEMCHWGWALKFQMLKPVLVACSLFLVPAYVKILATFPAPYLFVCRHAFCHGDNVLNL